MHYLIESRDRICVKRYGFLSFAKNMGKHLSNKYGAKPLNSAKKSTTKAIKTASKREIQKTAVAAGDLIGSKIGEKITSKAKKSNQREEGTPKETYISPENYCSKLLMI